MADETVVYPQAQGQSASRLFHTWLLISYTLPGSRKPRTEVPRSPPSTRAASPIFRGCPHTHPPASPHAGSELQREGASWGGGCGAEGGTEPLPSLVTFEKDRIRRKVNVTLLLGPEKREADPGF